jgi:hypothetical protein
MSRPEKFSTASGSDLLNWYWRIVRTTNLHDILLLLRDEVAREVREECAEQYRVCDSRRHELAGLLHDATARAERAERERDSERSSADMEAAATRKRQAMLTKIAAAVGEEFNPMATLVERVIAKTADAERKAFVDGANWVAEEASKLGLIQPPLYPASDPRPSTVAIRGYSAADEARRRYAPPAPAGVHGFAIEVRGDAPDDKVVVTKDGKPVFTITLADREGK